MFLPLPKIKKRQWRECHQNNIPLVRKYRRTAFSYSLKEQSPVTLPLTSVCPAQHKVWCSQANLLSELKLPGLGVQGPELYSSPAPLRSWRQSRLSNAEAMYASSSLASANLSTCTLIKAGQPEGFGQHSSDENLTASLCTPWESWIPPNFLRLLAWENAS